MVPRSSETTDQEKGNKTFLKPFVRGVANASRTVGVGISHAGKVVDAISDLTDKIPINRTTNGSTSVVTVNQDGELLLNSTENDLMGEDIKRGEKFKKNRGVFRKGISNVSESEGDQPSSQHMRSRIASSEVQSSSQEPSIVCQRRVGRSATDFVGFSGLNLEDDIPLFAQPYDLLEPRDLTLNVNSPNTAVEEISESQLSPISSLIHRRHSIQIPKDYNNFLTRDTVRKQEFQVRTVWGYRQLKIREEQLRKAVLSLEKLEEISKATAIEAETKAKTIKDKLESYLAKTKSNPIETIATPATNGISFDLGRNETKKNSSRMNSQSSNTIQNSRTFAMEKFDPEIWKLYKDLISAGEVMDQRKKEVSHKQKTFGDHVEALMNQAELLNPIGPVLPELSTPKDFGFEKSPIERNQNFTKKVTKRQRDTIAGMAEALVEGVEDDPAVRLGFFMDWVFEIMMVCLKEIIDRFILMLKWWIEMILMGFQAKLQSWSDRIKVKNSNKKEETEEEEEEEGLISDPDGIRADD